MAKIVNIPTDKKLSIAKAKMIFAKKMKVSHKHYKLIKNGREYHDRSYFNTTETFRVVLKRRRKVTFSCADM